MILFRGCIWNKKKIYNAPKKGLSFKQNKGWGLPGVDWTELYNMGSPEAFSEWTICFSVFKAANIDTVHTIKTDYRFNRNWNGLNVNVKPMKN